MAYTITVLPYERSFDCGEEETVLQAALRQGVLLPYGCKHGGCGRCKAMVLEGDVDPGEPSTYALMDFERQQGFTLLCSSIPESDLVIEVDAGPVDEVFQGAPILDFETEVKDVTTLTHDIRGVRLALIDPPEITFQAGQYVDGLVPGTQEWRSYSMASPPSSRRELEFMVKLMAGGLASSYVEGGLAIGERITVRGPYGSFRLRSEDRPAVMIAGGSGMAPILSMLRDLAERRSTKPLTFFYGARTKRDLFLLEEIEAIADSLPNFRFVPALSEATPEERWEGSTGLVTDVVARDFADMGGMEAYLCGPPGMIDAAIPMLRKHGVAESDVHYDKFLTKADLSRS
jgi:propane monooxygenase reductase component